MTQTIKMTGLHGRRAAMALVLAIMCVIAFIPPAAFTDIQTDAVSDASFIEGLEGQLSEALLSSQAGKKYMPPGAVITGSTSYMTPYGMELEVMDTAGCTIVIDSMPEEASGLISGSIIPAEGYKIASVSISAGNAALPSGSASDFILADLSEDGGSFSFTAPEGSERYVVTPYALSTKVWDGSVDVSWYDPSAEAYYIGEPAQLAGLAALINGRIDADTPASMIRGDASLIKSVAHPDTMLVGAGGGNVSDTVYTSGLDFAYKTVYLTADLDMGGVQTGGSWSGPNYTPVGGKYSMDTDMVDGDSLVIDTRFNGVFDGQGHSVNNIYCQRYSDKGFPYSMAVGLIGYLGGNLDISSYDAASFENGWQPAVRNVVVGNGYIRGRRMIGGVVGRVGATSNGVIIENCANHAAISNTDAKGVGGILGSCYGKGVIRNCYNTGSVSTTYSCPAGGIIGANAGMDIYNCYNVGKIDSNGTTRGRGIGGHDTGSYTVDNCYTLKGCDDDPDSEGYFVGSSKKITVNVTQLTSSQMQGSGLADKLNVNGTVFTSVSGKNNGYPVLYFEASGYKLDGSFSVEVSQAANGKISVDADGSAGPGQVLNLYAQPEAGYKLDYFTVNGKPISGDFFIATGDMKISGVFKEIKEVTVSIPSSSDYSLVVTATGYIMDGGELKQVKNQPIYNGAKVMEGTILLARAHVYSDAVPSDKNKEYTGIVEYSATNAVKNSVGKYTVSGSGNVAIGVNLETRDFSWISIADTSWYIAKKNAYTITSREQLAGLAKLVNEEGLDFSGKTVNLGADISLAGGNWTPVGNSNVKCFRGTFDGNGHVIGGMTCDSGSSSYSGLFGFCTDAVVKNVTVRGSSRSGAGISYSAGIIAFASNSLIENCTNRAEVTAAGDFAGGITACGSEATQIKNCQNYAHITGSTGVGGIAGICESSACVISACQNLGQVSATGSSLGGAGGITGKTPGTITDCVNAGSIDGNDRYTGGILGYSTGRKTSKVENCQNTGSVTSAADNENAGLGGIIGYAQFGSYSNDSNTGKIIAGSGFKSSGIGSILGRVGNEPALNVALDCVYDSSACSYAAAKGSYDGISAGTVTLAPYETKADPGDPSSAGAGQQAGPSARVNEICGGQTIGSGSYYLVNYAAGQLEVAPGADVVLIGTGRTLGYLTITVGDGAKLTLRDVEYSGDDTLIAFRGKGSLIMEGSSSVIGLSDTGGNEVPTIYAADNLDISGSGAMYVEAGRGNAAVKIASGHTLNLKGGRLSVYKKDLLGEAGGAVFANGGTVNICGGALEGTSDSDNISIISADTVNISSGSVNLIPLRSPKTIDAKVINITGGMIKARGYSGNCVDADQRRAYMGLESMPNVKGSGTAYELTGSFSKTVPSAQNILVDGEKVDMEIYNIDGSNYFKLRDVAALMAGTKSEFSVDFNGDFKSMYTVKGAPYTAVGGEMLTGTDKSSSCTASTWALYVNGKLINCKVYNIGGNNFFKLRDLGTAFGIGVDYDQTTNTAYINS